jgi:hypothetical protein
MVCSFVVHERVCTKPVALPPKFIACYCLFLSKHFNIQKSWSMFHSDLSVAEYQVVLIGLTTKGGAYVALSFVTSGMVESGGL